ncbi:hypothetical protein L227DRAFT_470825, partial [Lentinus tigrinus ALCF2SS1-6]
IEPRIARLLTASHSRQLQWDVAEHPSKVKVRRLGSSVAQQLSPEDLAQCAVSTSGRPGNMREMLQRITLVFPGLPLMVEIKPADAPVWIPGALPYVTVGNVLYGLYEALQVSIRRQEFDALSRAHRDAVSRVFYGRIARDPESYDQNMRRGVRRIDYLGEMRGFVSL